MRRWQRRITMAGAMSGAFVLAALVGWLARDRSPPSEIEALVVAAEARHTALFGSRDAAWGETRNGAAFVHYDEAKRLAEPLDVAFWHADQKAAFRMRHQLSPSELASLRASWAPALAMVTRGARCRDALPRPDPECRWVSLSIAMDLELGVCVAERRWREAVQLWLDKGTFLVDHDQFPGGGGIWSDDVVHALPPAIAELLDRGVAILDRRLQSAPDYAASLAAQARRLLYGEYPITFWCWREVLDAWQWDFDPAERHLAAFARTCSLLDELPTAGPSFEGRDAQWEELLRRAKAEEADPLVELGVTEARNRERGQRWALTHLRTLRIGLATHLGRPLPQLADPWSGALLRVEHADGAVVVHPAQSTANPVRWTTRRPVRSQDR